MKSARYGERKLLGQKEWERQKLLEWERQKLLEQKEWERKKILEIEGEKQKEKMLKEQRRRIKELRRKEEERRGLEKTALMERRGKEEVKEAKTAEEAGILAKLYSYVKYIDPSSLLSYVKNIDPLSLLSYVKYADPRLFFPVKTAIGSNVKVPIEPQTEYNIKFGKEKIKIVGTIGRGGFGVVYKVKILGKEGFFALKQIDVNYNYGIIATKEVDISLSITHDNIIKFYNVEYGSAMGNPLINSIYILMPFADNTLYGYMRSNVVHSNVELQKNLVFQVLNGLAALHKAGVYHCDIKPDNILMFGNKAVISDLGISVYKDTKKGSLCATHHYAPPEALVNIYGMEAIAIPGFQTDLDCCDYSEIEKWSLGCLIAFIASGNDLFLTPAPNDHRKSVYNTYRNIITYSHDPIKYLTEKRVNPAWYTLLLKLLVTDKNGRIKTLSEILSFEIFRGRVLVDPVITSTEIKYNAQLDKPKELVDLLNGMKRICDELKLTVQTFMEFIQLFYRLHIKFAEKHQVYTIAIVCLSIAATLHERYKDFKIINTEKYLELLGRANIYYSKKDFTWLQFIYIKAADGILFTNTLFVDVYSYASLIRSIKFMYNYKLYITTKPNEFIITIQSLESSEERRNRRSKYVLTRDIREILEPL